MNQSQFYKYATWGLLLLNLSMVAFFFLTAPPRHQGTQAGGNRVAHILNLDKQQNEAFLRLAREHMQQMDDLTNQQRNVLKPYFSSLIQSDRAINTDSLLMQTQRLERQKIESTYRHFQDVKSILKPEQYPDFETFIEHAMGRILAGQKNNPPPPKDFD